MDQHLKRGRDNLDVSPHGPVCKVLQIRLEAVGKILHLLCSPPISSHLRESGQAGLYRVSMPVGRINVPEKSIFCARAESVRPWPDDAHRSRQDIKKLR